MELAKLLLNSYEKLNIKKQSQLFNSSFVISQAIEKIK